MSYPNATGVLLTNESLGLQVGGIGLPMATFSPMNSLREMARWTSSDENVATVSTAGIITALAPGEAVITALSERGLMATCAITVAEALN